MRAARSRAREEQTDPETGDTARPGLVTHAALAHLVEEAMAGRARIDPTVADQTVRRRGLAQSLIEDVVPLVAAGLRTIRDRKVSPLAVEQRIEVDIGADIVVEGWADLVVENGAAVEVWDWKTSAAIPPTREDLRDDVQAAAYLSWLRAAYPDAIGWRARWIYLRHGPRVVSVDWSAGMEQQLVVEARRAVMHRAITPDKATGTPGGHCCWCPFRGACEPLDTWLTRAAFDATDGDTLKVLATAYVYHRDVEKVAGQKKKDLADRIDVLLGDERKLEHEGARATRVTQTRESWSAGVVTDLAAALGEPAGDVWARVGKVDARKVDAEIAALPAEARGELEDYREVRESSHVRVGVK